MKLQDLEESFIKQARDNCIANAECDECKEPAEFELEGRTILCEMHFLIELEEGSPPDCDREIRRAESGYAD